MANWLDNNWDFAKKYCFQRDGDPERFGRLVCPWTEKTSTVSEENATHYYAPLIDLKTGKIYLELSKRAIFFRFCAQVLLRPFSTISKTAYHLFLPLSVPFIIQEAIEEKKQNGWNKTKTFKYGSVQIAKSIVDIVRTPFYGTILTIMSIATICFYLFNKGAIYRLLIVAGKMEKRLYWNRFHAPGTLFHCFQPDTSVQKLQNRWKNHHNLQDTVYLNDNPTDLAALSNYARKFIRNERKLALPHICLTYTIEQKQNLPCRVSNFLKQLHPLKPKLPTQKGNSTAEDFAKLWRQSQAQTLQ